MEQHRADAHPIDIEQHWDDPPPHFTPLGSPSYSPPELDEPPEAMEGMRNDQDEAEDADDEERETDPS